MTSRSLLLTSAALLLPISPVVARQQAPTPPTDAAPTAPASSAVTPATGTPDASDDYGHEEAIVVTGARPRRSVVADIPPENTLDSRDVRATGATNIGELLDALAPQI